MRLPWKKRSENSNVSFLLTQDAYDTLCVSGYTTLANNPEIRTAVDRIASLIGSMTIYLMANTAKGDTRIKNELSSKIDINPWTYGTRTTWMQTIVRNLLLDGNGNSIVLPVTEMGYIRDLIPVPASYVTMQPKGIGLNGYTIYINGTAHDPADVLHFVNNPDPTYPWKGQGYRVVLKDIAENLKQASATEKGFLSSKWKPSVIVKVDALTEEFASPEGRKKLLESYIETNEVGEPWMIPAEQFQIEQIKPLSLNDLAIKDTVELNKRTVASILGVPPFVLGVGEFSKEAWNNFINTTIMPIAKEIEQELTKKLLLSDRMYFRFNIRSLYTYDIQQTASVGAEMFVRGIMTGNEVRDSLGLSPMDGLDELVLLENYIPLDRIGDQKKLVQDE